MDTSTSSSYHQHNYYTIDESYIPERYPNAPAYNLINFIAVSQALKLSFLHVTWQAARGVIGIGGSGSINQALINLHTSFAFKFVSNKTKQNRSKDSIYRSLINEVTALGHPAARRHLKIAELQGICWDIETDEEGQDKIWPVLVFKKSQYGDLDHFMQLPVGRALDSRERFSLCFDVGFALSDMHKNGILHGDIKPANVLVFKDAKGSDRFTARVIDFGFSTRFAGKDDPVVVGHSWPWSAPECQKLCSFSATQVRQMDMFSFGTLFVWVLFERYLSRIDPLPEDARWAEQYFVGKGQHSSSKEVLEGLKNNGKIAKLAKQLMNEEKSADDQTKQKINRFFDEALSAIPEERVHATDSFPYAEIQNKWPMKQDAVEEHNREVLQCRFELTSFVTPFYMSDYRLRRHFRRLLEQHQRDTPDPHTAFQLALCNAIGFGAPRQDKDLTSALQRSGRSQKELEDSLAKMRPFETDEEEMPGKIYRRLYMSGHMTDLSPSEKYGVKLKEAEAQIRQELADLESCLGETSRLWMINAFELSKIQEALGRWEDAIDLQVKLMEITKTRVDDSHHDMQNIKTNVARSFNRLGRWKEAQDLQMQVVKVRKEVLGHDHADTLHSMDALASMYNDQGQWKKSEELQVHVLNERMKVLGEEHEHTLNSMERLASTYREQGLWEKSRNLHERVVKISKAISGDEHPSTLTYIENLATLDSRRGQWTTAHEREEQLVELRKTALGERHPHTLSSMSGLAVTLSRQGDHVRSEQMSRKVLDLTEDTPRKSLSTWRTMANLAEALNSQGKYTEAENMHREVLEFRMKVLGKEHEDTLNSMHNLAGTLRDRGNFAEAEPLLREAIALRTELMGKEYVGTLTSMNSLGNVLSSRGMYTEAEKVHHETLALREKVLGMDHHDTLISMNNLSLVFRETGNYDEAERLAKECLILREKKFGKGHGLVLGSMNNLAKIHVNQRRYEEAEKMLWETYRRKAEVSGEKHPNTLMVKNNLAEALSGQGKWVDAQQMHQDILASRMTVLGKKHPNTLLSKVNLARSLSGQGNHEDALRLYEEACKTYQDTLGADHPDTQACLKHCADSRRQMDERSSRQTERDSAEAV